MQQTLYPSQKADLTTESFLSRHSKKSQVIYSTIVLAVIVALALLPVLKVDVSVQATGIIRPVCEKNEIKPLVSGTISKIHINENQFINKDSLLVEIDSKSIQEKIRLNNYCIKKEKNYIHDYEFAITNFESQATNLFGFKTKVCLQEWLLFVNRLKENSVSSKELNNEFERMNPLFKKKIISAAELEKKEFEIKQNKIQKEAIVEQQLSKWHNELYTRKLKLNELLSEREQLEKEVEFYTIKSPVAGTVEQFSGLSVGSYIQAGQLLAIISPDTDLIAEMYVSPKDIGLIKKSAEANFQVDAFDYHQWGMLKGKVVSISDDFLQFDNQPMFRVRCKLNKSFLELKNGYRGRLKKGMTLRARFLVTRRSLFQLLYDKVDDWLNPVNN